MSTSAKELIQTIVVRSLDTSELLFPISYEEMEILDGYVTDDVSIADGKIHLKNLSIKSKIIAEYYYRTIGEDKDLNFFEKARWLYCEMREYKQLEIVEEYISIGSQDIDIFQNAKRYAQNYNDIFTLLQILILGMNKIVAYQYASFIDFFIFAHERIKNDLTAGRYIKSLCEFLFKNKENCLRAYREYFETKNELLIPLYNSIVLHLFKSQPYMKNKIIDEIKSNDNVDANSLYLLGRILIEEEIHSGVEIDILIAACTEKKSEDQRSAAFNALALHLGKSQEVDKFFKQELINRNIQAIVALAYILYFNLSDFTEHPDFELWLESLAYVPSEMKGAEKWRDSIYSQTLVTHYSITIQSIERCIYFYTDKNESIDITKKFHLTIHEFSNHPYFGTQLLIWINNKTYILAKTARDIIQSISTQKIPFNSFEISNLHIVHVDDVLFLCRRILGYVSEHQFLFSALCSLANFYKDDSHCLNIISQSLDIVAFDYPPQARKALAKICDDSPETNLAEQAKILLDKMEIYFNALHVLPIVPELYPLRAEKILFQKERHKHISRLMREAQKQSILGQISSSVSLKAGKAFFSFRGDSPDSPTSLGTFETSFILPRSLVFDPVQYELQRLTFREQTMGKNV
jgi:hypothetical protein